MISMIAVLTASIPAVALIIVQVIISMKQQRVQDVRFELTINEIKNDIKRLEDKQDKHNELISRVTRLEIRDEAEWKRIDELKGKL